MAAGAAQAPPGQAAPQQPQPQPVWDPHYRQVEVVPGGGRGQLRRYRPHLKVRGQLMPLGDYSTALEAATAYDVMKVSRRAVYRN